MTKTQSNDQLPRVAWDFEANDLFGYLGCPDEELYACTFWEYAKESSVWLNVLKGDFEQLPKGFIPHYSQPANFLGLFSDFRALHWLEIPPEKRTERLKKFVSGVKFRTEPIEAASVNILMNRNTGQFEDVVSTNIPSRGFGKLSTATTLPFTICWAYSDLEILQTFKEWLRDNRATYQQDPKERREPRRGKNPFRADVLRANLKALGALRLLRVMSPEKAIEFTKTFLRTQAVDQYALFNDPSSWWRGKRHALNILENFSSSGLPITDNGQFPDAISSQLGKPEIKNLIFVSAMHNRRAELGGFGGEARSKGHS